ncbi:MAG: hypothetical protein AWU57_802 [Marinobacter sp. T13-3]|nr:MAG: hypothetical protein AWU57_802 [Marinobacter sp. T13-3]
MTAEELIKRLKTLSPETHVLVEGYETGYDDIVDLKAEDVFRYRRAQEWDGEYQKQDEVFGKGSKTVPAAVIIGRRGPLR